MSDIVERIREEVRDWKCGPVVAEAADHIEVLRGLLKSAAQYVKAAATSADAHPQGREAAMHLLETIYVETGK